MGIELAYTALGQRPAVVMLHGLFGSARNWQSVGKELAAAHPVFLLDLRNHGHSPWHQAMSYWDLAEDVRAFVQRHALPRPVLCGHSMGGKAAMLLALQHPHLVSRLIVVDIAPVAYRHTFGPFVQALQALDTAALRSRADADRALAPRITDSAIRSFLLQNLVWRDGTFHWRVNLAALAASMRELTDFPAPPGEPVFAGPTLFVAGARSDYVRPQHHGEIMRRFPDARVVVIPDAGHWVHADQPRRLLDTLLDFLAS